MVLASAALLFAAVGGAAPLVLKGNSGSVNSVAFSPDGTKVLTGSANNAVKLWDAGTGMETTAFVGHTADVTSVAFSPDGKRLLSGSGDCTARLWNANTGQVVFTFAKHVARVSSVAFSPDGSQALTGSWDGTAKIWDTAKGTLVRSISHNSANWVSAVAFSPDGTEELTAASDGSITRWDAGNGAPLHTYTGHSTLVHSLMYSADGNRFASSSWDGTAKLWNVQAGTTVRTFDVDTNAAFSAVFSPDGAVLLTGGSDQFAKLWNLSTGALERTITGHTGEVTSTAFSPDGTMVLTGSSDGTARLQSIAMAGTIVINDNRSTTNNPAVTLALACSPSPATQVTDMRFSDDGAHWTVWQALAATLPHTLPAGDGYKTVRVQFRNSAGTVSATFSDYIRLDTAPPTGAIIINGGAAATASRTVTLGLTWSDGAGAGVTRMRFSDDGAHWTVWETPKATRAYTLPLPNGYHTVRVQYRDGAGNISAAYNDYIRLAMP